MRRFETTDTEWETIKKGLDALKAKLVESNLRIQGVMAASVFEASKRNVQLSEMQKNSQEIKSVEELWEKLSRMPPARRGGV